MNETGAITESTATKGALCEARHVSHDFVLPNGRPQHILDDISFQVMPDEVVALLGPSGCGKSTMLRILAGLIKPTRGEVLYEGRPLTGLNPGVAIVFQSFALFPWMTVRQNVEAVLRAAGYPRTDVAEHAEKTIGLVGLAGYEDSYPRELSGGMKQRVGMARALAVNPKVLFMDEPFSQVDALTAESLRAEVLDIWQSKETNPSSILMISHDIKEVCFVADRIVIFGANPGRVRRIVENRMPRPRDYRSPELLRLMDQLHEIITGSEMPDVAPAAEPQAAEIFEPLPNATGGEIVGLLEYLDARGGRQDVFRIAADLNREFGKMIAVVKAAEMLDFVLTPKSLVSLEPLGKRFVDADPAGRKTIWREQLMKLRLFSELDQVLKRQPKRAVPREFVLEMIALFLPLENDEATFETLIHWARFADLFEYDEETETLSLE